MPITCVRAMVRGHGAFAWNNARKSADPPGGFHSGHTPAGGNGWNQIAADEWMGATDELPAPQPTAQFNIITAHANARRNGWRNPVPCFVWLFNREIGFILRLQIDALGSESSAVSSSRVNISLRRTGERRRGRNGCASSRRNYLCTLIEGIEGITKRNSIFIWWITIHRRAALGWNSITVVAHTVHGDAGAGTRGRNEIPVQDAVIDCQLTAIFRQYALRPDLGVADIHDRTRATGFRDRQLKNGIRKIDQPVGQDANLIDLGVRHSDREIVALAHINLPRKRTKVYMIKLQLAPLIGESLIDIATHIQAIDVYRARAVFDIVAKDDTDIVGALRT